MLELNARCLMFDILQRTTFRNETLIEIGIKLPPLRITTFNSNKYPKIKFNYLIVAILKGYVWVETSRSFAKNKKLISFSFLLFIVHSVYLISSGGYIFLFSMSLSNYILIEMCNTHGN